MVLQEKGAELLLFIITKTNSQRSSIGIWPNGINSGKVGKLKTKLGE